MTARQDPVKKATRPRAHLIIVPTAVDVIRMKWEFVCRRCGRHRLFFWRPSDPPVCRHGRRWVLFADRMHAL